MTITVLLPIIAALLIVLFYVGLPSLRDCPLQPAEAEAKKMTRGDWLAALCITLCYAVVAYQTAYLKCHYPREYMAALMTSVLDSATKISGYIAN